MTLFRPSRLVLPRPSRRRVLGGLAAGAATALLPAAGGGGRAQAADPTYKIFMITWRGWEDASQGFKDYLDRRGVRTELIVRDAGRSRDKVAEHVQEAKATRPDLVYTWGTTTALTAFGKVGQADPATQITDIPSVFTIVSDPIGSDLVEAYDEPRPNLTGTLYIAPVETQLRTIQAYGEFKSLGAVFNPQESNARLTIAQVAKLAERDGFRLIQQPATIDASGKPDPASIPEKVRAVKDQGAEWLYIPPDSFLNVNRDSLTSAAMNIGLPSFAGAENFIRDSHGLLGLVSRYYNVGQFTGYIAEQILVGGKKPSEIPIESLDRFSLLVNMETARTLGFYPPMSMLTIAEFVQA
ncbi:putative ABC transport system substrate-binding protein [Tistlia consotensis]|uniref:Putative ABC transport system substrate-binding protein n=1 Tax=Tistlia consotensis USBA 355 TaxID=560819 RepID=A0A1Y6CX84_9PROT|nr:ABC transporter substrate-binding protein [Tistlia consotensis]SMF81256.1 putative ABC transport system substrate-binding protein [Tistlia consotensis USBA 355]SNS23164.1 putative ABC transport system substrate-binding protein [Tistlia consotensis]